jgi:hypothetical protein
MWFQAQMLTAILRLAKESKKIPIQDAQIHNQTGILLFKMVVILSTDLLHLRYQVLQKVTVVALLQGLLDTDHRLLLHVMIEMTKIMGQHQLLVNIKSRSTDPKQ